MRVEQTLEVLPLSARSSFCGRVEGITAALSYALSSICLIIFNKAVFSTFGFKSPIIVCLCHMVVSFTFVVMLKAVGLIEYKDFDRHIFIRMIPLSVCFVCNILLGLLGTKLISLPMFTTLRRLTPMFILCCGYSKNGIVPSSSVIIAVILLITGAAVAAYNDLYFDPLGYLVVLVNDLATAGYLQITSDIKDEVGKFGLLFYNSMISMTILLCLSFLHDEFTYVAKFENINNNVFLMLLLLGGVLAFAVNLTIAWCTQANSPLTTSITGEMKNIVPTLLGAMMFTDFYYDDLLVLGIFIAIIGSLIYAYTKYKEKFSQ